jgi:hypothetical protein
VSDSTAAAGTGNLLTPVSPSRVLDTRPGSGEPGAGRTLSSGKEDLAVQVAGVGTMPSSASATPPTVAVLNVTVTDTTMPGYLTVYPSNVSKPLASDLNWSAGQTVANMVVVELAPGGTIDVSNYQGKADVIVDVLGYLTTATTTWTEAVPASATTPPVVQSAYATATYDAATNQDIMAVINTAGRGFSTWAWDGSNWTDEASAHQPSLFGNFGQFPYPVAYDAAAGNVVLLAVDETSNPQTGQTWSWNGSDWTELFPATEPNQSGLMVYDAANRTVVLFDNTGSTWTWDGSNWTKQSPATSPSSSSSSGGMAYDPVTQSVVIFGGASACGQSVCYIDQTWSWNGATWTKLSPATSPSSRASTTMAFDPALGSSGEMVLFGGTNGNQLDDTWAWDGTNWTQLPPQDSPPGTAAATMAFDGSMLMMFDTNTGDTWHYPTS